MITIKDYEYLKTLISDIPQAEALLERLREYHLFTIHQISHEVRNALTLVGGSLQMLEVYTPSVREPPYWSQLEEDVSSAQALLDGLSQYNNSTTLSIRTFNMNYFLKSLALSFAASITDSQTTFTSRISSQITTYEGDALKLRKALLNLLKNAVEAAPEGSVTLHASHLENGIQIEIKDDGRGITKEQLLHIFEPFATYKSTGTGLGLPLSRNTILAHGGTLDIVSTPGHGTLARVFLPIQKKGCEETTGNSA